MLLYRDELHLTDGCSRLFIHIWSLIDPKIIIETAKMIKEEREVSTSESKG